VFKGEREDDRPDFSWLEPRLPPSLEIEERARNARHDVAHEEEDRWLRCALASIDRVYLDAQREVAINHERLRARAQIGQLDGAVGEPMTERELGLYRDVEILAREEIVGIGWAAGGALGEENRDLPHVTRPGHGKTRARIEAPGQYVGNRRPRHRAGEPGCEHGRCALEKPGQGERPTGKKDHDDRRP